MVESSIGIVPEPQWLRVSTDICSSLIDVCGVFGDTQLFVGFRFLTCPVIHIDFKSHQYSFFL